MLTLNDLSYCYQSRTLSFTLQAAKGERLAILGPSGAGKSTLLSLIAGFLPVTGGELWIDGENCTRQPPAERPVSMLFQENNLFAHLNVQQNLGLGLHPGLRLSSLQKQQVSDILHQVGMEGLADRLPGQLSGGQRQRVALARCLLRQRPLLLLDEPFSALDPHLRQEMITLTDTLCREQNITLLMVSHHEDDVRQIADRAIVIRDGHVALEGDIRSDAPVPGFSPGVRQ